MRPLTIEELELVAGGSGTTGEYDSTIIVPGHGGGGIVVTAPGSGGSAGGGSGGGVPAPEVEPCPGGAAVSMGEHLHSLSTSTGYEFLTAIARNEAGTYSSYDGEYHTMYSPTQASMPDIPDASSVVGTIHNHPWNSSDQNQNYLNRYPSSGDWQAADRLVANGADASQMKVYIVDPWGHTREYKYTDKALYLGMTDSQRISSQNLAAEAVACG